MDRITESEVGMNDLHDDTRIDEALALIDEGLGSFSDRQLLSSSEVADLLLDVRSLIVRATTELSAN